MRRTGTAVGWVELFTRPNSRTWHECWVSPVARLRASSTRYGRSTQPTASRPRPGGLRLLLEALDLVLLDHRQADVVEAVEQAMLAVGVDLELDHAAVGAPDLLLLQVDRQRGIGAALGIVEQLLQVLGRDLDRQHAVLETVVVENVAERGRDHAADAEIH